MRYVLTIAVAAICLLSGSAEAQYGRPGYGPLGYGDAPPPGYYGPPPCPPDRNVLKGAAKGAAGGTLLGVILGGDPRKGAALGAAIGGLAGAAQHGSKKPNHYCR